MAGPGKSGPRLRLTPELIEDAAKVLRAGNYIKTTCGYLGINNNTWTTWINHANHAEAKPEEERTDNDRLYIAFKTETQKAADEAIVRNLQIIQQAAIKNWQAAAWTLERRYPDMFSLAQRITMEDKAQGLTAAELKAKLAERKKAGIAEMQRLQREQAEREAMQAMDTGQTEDTLAH